MTERQNLLARLAALEAEEPEQVDEHETQSAVTETQDPFNPAWRLPADWKPPARYVTDEYARDYATGFAVGDYWHDSRGPEFGWKPFMQAVPHPRYNAEVGSLITETMEAEYNREWSLWFDAGQRLQRLVCSLYWQKYPFGQSSYDGIDEDRAYLTGVWTSRGIEAPSEETLQSWVQELREKYEQEQERLKGLSRA